MEKLDLQEFATVIKRKILEEAIKDQAGSRPFLIYLAGFIDEVLRNFEYERKMRKFLHEKQEEE